MTANELRIGNCVWSNDGHYDRVEDAITAIERGRVSTRFCKARYIPIEYIEAIPLTEEWLLRMGFDFDSQSQTFSVLGVNNLYGWVFEVHMSDGNFLWSAMPVYWVHQLQNLFYCLVGEELTIKEQ